MRYNKHFSSFSSGEISPKLHSRVDLQQYPTGVAEMKNFIVQKSGGAHRRPGTVVKAAVSTSEKVMIPYRGIYTDYIIEIRLDNRIINQTGLASAIIIHALGPNATAPPISTTTTTADTTKTTSLSPNLEIEGFAYVQAAADLIITHASGLMNPMTIVETSLGDSPLTSMTIEPYFYGDLADVADSKRYIERMPIVDRHTQEISMSFSATGAGAGGVIIAPSGVTITASAYAFSPTSIGKMMYVEHGAASEGVIYITQYNSPTSVTGLVLAVLTATTGTTDYSYGYFSVDVFPRALAVYQSRLHFLSTVRAGNTYWASRTEDFNLLINRRLAQDTSSAISGLEYFGALTPADGFHKIIAENEPSVIKWAISDGVLRLGTTVGDYAVSSGNTDEGYSKNTATITKESSIIATYHKPYMGDNKVIYIANNGRQVRTIDTKSGDFAYRNIDLSIVADHMYYKYKGDAPADLEDAAFKRVVWDDRASVLWVLNRYNVLLGLTISTDSNVVAWHVHEFGGDVTVIDLVSIRYTPDGISRLILHTQRPFPFGGGNQDYLEEMGQEFNHPVLKTNNEFETSPAFLDFTVRQVDVAKSNFTGLILHAETLVTVVADDYTVYEDVEVNAAGEMSLPADHESIVVGYSYTSRIKSLILEAGQQFGNSRGNISRIDKVTLSLHNTAYALVGTDEDMNDVEIEDTELYTGDVAIDFTSSLGNDPAYIIETGKPLPLNVLGVTTSGVAYDR